MLGTTSAAPAAASARVMPPAATDALSGVQRYAYRLRQVNGTTPQPYDATTWPTVAAGTAMSVTAPGEVAYDRDWVIDVVAIDAAGNASAVTQTQAFRFRDITPPSTPDYCVTTEGNGATVTLNARADDPETFIDGYQFSLTRNGQMVRPFPTNGAPDVTPGNAASFSVAGGLLLDGARHVLSLRTLNGQRAVSTERASIELQVDNSAPPTPTITSVTLLSTTTCNGQSYDAATQRCVEAVFTAPTDPHSGLDRVEWRMESTAPPPPGSLALIGVRVFGEPTWTSAAAGTTRVTTLVNWASTATVTFRLRSVNGVQTPSAEATRQGVEAPVLRSLLPRASSTTTLRFP